MRCAKQAIFLGFRQSLAAAPGFMISEGRRNPRGIIWSAEQMAHLSAALQLLGLAIGGYDRVAARAGACGICAI